MARTLALVAAAGVLGFLLGVLIPTPAQGAGWTPKFLFTPQAGLDTTCLSCGWHSACVYPYPWGTALDFPANCSDSGQDVYFRNFGFKPSGGEEWVAWGTPFTDLYATCKTTYVWTFDKNINRLGTMYYVHTYKTRDADMMMYVSEGGHKNEYVFARMVDADNANCPGWVWLEEEQMWYWPRHLHETHLNDASTFYLRDDGDCGSGDRYPCGPQSPPYSPYDPQDWWNDWTRTLCLDDTDSDGDGLPSCLDNCPPIANPGQQDADSDGIGNVCELDVDCSGGGPNGADALMILQYIVGRASLTTQCPPPAGYINGPRASAYYAYPEPNCGTIGDAVMVLQCIVGRNNIVCPAS